MFEIIGISFAITGAIASLVGSWLVSSSTKEDRRDGYFIWMCGNPINITVLIGVMLGLWTCLPLIITVLVQVYYMCTAYRGYRSNE